MSSTKDFPRESKYTLMLEAWSSLSYWRVDREAAPQYCLNVWLEQHRRISKMGKPLGAGRFMRIRAEDMVNKPLDVLPGFCSWMSISDSVESLDEMMHPERSRYASWGPVNAGGGYDPKFMANPRLRRVETPSPFLPDHWRVDDGVLRAVVDLAGKFGYECEGSSLSFDGQGVRVFEETIRSGWDCLDVEDARGGEFHSYFPPPALFHPDSDGYRPGKSALDAVGQARALNEARRSLTARFSRNQQDGAVRMAACVHIFTGAHLGSAPSARPINGPDPVCM
jgi:hypothetical protein